MRVLWYSNSNLEIKKDMASANADLSEMSRHDGDHLRNLAMCDWRPGVYNAIQRTLLPSLLYSTTCGLDTKNMHGREIMETREFRSRILPCARVWC
jgi:hypothetical protein